MNEGGIPALILDILETNCGDWYDIARVVGEVQERRPDTRYDTIRRAIERLKTSSMVEWDLRERADATYWGHFGRTRTYMRIPWRSYWEETA